MIDTNKLENVSRKEDSGKITARCPACAEAGADKTGEHLVIMADGKFGCAVNPGEAGHDHRQRIFQLVGVPDGRVRVGGVVKNGSFGRVGRGFRTLYVKKKEGITPHIHTTQKTAQHPSDPSEGKFYAMRVLNYGDPPQLVEIDRETGYPIIDGAICQF
jgi:hypothetical protein